MRVLYKTDLLDSDMFSGSQVRNTKADFVSLSNLTTHQCSNQLTLDTEIYGNNDIAQIVTLIAQGNDELNR